MHDRVDQPKPSPARPEPPQSNNMPNARTLARLLDDLGRLLLGSPQLSHAPGRHGSRVACFLALYWVGLCGLACDCG